MSKLTLVKSENFGTVKCDFYRNEKNEYFMTREQIGMALEYSDHRVAIAKIHERHKERLDQFSGVTKLVTPEGGTQDTYIYSRKGIMELCRWSRQPKADMFMDWVWDVIEQISETGGYIPVSDDTSDAEIMARGLIIAHKTIESKDRLLVQKEDTIKLLIPKAEAYDAVINSKGALSMSQFAKSVKWKKGSKYGRNELYELLREQKIIQKNSCEPYEKYIKADYFILSEYVDEFGYVATSVKVTPKGIDFLLKKLKEWGLLQHSNVLVEV